MAQFLFGVFQFFDGADGVLQRDQAHAVKSFGVVAAIVGEPGVVGAADCGAQLGIEIVAPHDVETEGWEEHAHIDAFAIHVAHVGRGVEFRRQRIGESLAPALGAGEGKTEILLLRSITQFIGVGNRFAVDGAARLIGTFDLDTIAKFRRQVFFEQIARLEHMPVGIDDLESISHGALLTLVIARDARIAKNR